MTSRVVFFLTLPVISCSGSDDCKYQSWFEKTEVGILIVRGFEVLWVVLFLGGGGGVWGSMRNKY